MDENNKNSKKNQNKGFKIIIASLIVIVLLIKGSDYWLYTKLTTDFNSKISTLDQKAEDIKNELEVEKKFSTKQRNLLENRTLDNLKKVQSDITKVTSKLKLDIETVKVTTEIELKGISQDIGSLEEKSSLLEERSIELSDKISEIDVESSDFSAIVEDVVKAVVSIKTNLGQGSGVIFDSRGYVITNKHVVEGITSAQVMDYDSNSYSISIIGLASNIDLAVIKINSEKIFNYLNFADSSNIKVGERVIAVGNPLGLSFSVTEGIISGLNRVIDNSGVQYIQTDVPINPGNSGGPLINSNKEIVGINTLKISDTEGLGFAIPSNTAKDIADKAVG